MVTLIHPNCSDSTAVVARAGLIGLWAGAALGAVVGTIAVPLLGTIVGAVIGCEFGGLFGLANGLALAAVARVAPYRPGLSRLVAGAVSAVLAAVVFGFGLALDDPGDPLFTAVITAVSGVLGVVLGPWALRRPTPAGSAAAAPVARGAGFGAVTGAVGGVAAGLVLGLATYPPTAWFAGVELGVPGTVAGAILGTFVGCVVAARRSWRRVHAERRARA